MIRSVHNPPMGKDDVVAFRNNLEKHLRNEYSTDEKLALELKRARTEANAKKIITNCGGKNPILGH